MSRRPIYKQAQINHALSLVNTGFTRKEAAKKTKMNVHSLNYYIAHKASPKLRQILLRRSHIKAIKTLAKLL